jgi:hypothetical protein
MRVQHFLLTLFQRSGLETLFAETKIAFYNPIIEKNNKSAPFAGKMRWNPPR